MGGLLSAGFAIGASSPKTPSEVAADRSPDVLPSASAPPDVLAMVEVNSAASPAGNPDPTDVIRLRTDAFDPVTSYVHFGPVTVSELRSQLQQADVDRRESPIAVTGRIVGPHGPLADATVQIADVRNQTDESGRFHLDDIDRANHLVEIRKLGHTSRVVGVVGDREAGVDTIDLGDLELVATAPGRATMIFGGDTSLGRRFIDPEGVADRDELPPENPDAFISLDNTAEDTRRILDDLGRIISPYDLVSINLETVVTDDPSTPQEEQTFVFHTLPGSVDALADIGVDHVSLGNNHVWDYGEKGVEETAATLTAAGIAHSGSGHSADEAFEPSVMELPNFGSPIALHSWVAIENIPEPYPPAATDTKGGGANASDLDRVRAAVAQTESDDMLTVAIPHVGYEYTESIPHTDPVRFVQDRLYAPLEAGADLVVGSHPHIAQGFEFRDGVLIAHSLGNLAFDQPRLDTLFGAMLAVAFDDQTLAQARVEPVFIKDFVPTVASGEPADQLLRRLAWNSATDVVLAPDGTSAVITSRAEATERTRTVEMVLEPGPDGVAMVDLRDLRLPGESIGQVTQKVGMGHGGGGEHSGLSGATVSIGRDLMMLGDMEDHDFDATPEQIAPWNFGSAGFVCGSQARRGAGALCSTRSAHNEGTSTLGFGQRIRVVGDRINDPNKDLTLLVYERGVNRGDVSIGASYRASQGSREFGDEVLADLPARSGDFAQHWLDLNMPVDDPQYIESLPLDRPFRMRPQFRSARAVRITIDHFPPADGTGLLVLDDVALVSWEEPTLLDNGDYRTPSPMDFLRVGDLTEPTLIEIAFVSWEAPRTD